MTRQSRHLPHALECLNDLCRHLDGRTLAVFLDYDGTLAPIAPTPDAAVMPTETRDILRRLAARYTVGIVSGRDRADVEQKVGIPDLIYAGAHGFDIGGGVLGENALSIGSNFAESLTAARRKLEKSLAGVEGALIEVKTKSVVVHYRLAGANDVPAIMSAARQAIVDGDGLRLMSGKKILEILPDVDWNKGQALLWLSEALKLNSDDAAVIYIGDDVTDEDAFKVLEQQGIGIRVTDPSGHETDTAATYRLNDPNDVAQFITALADMAL